ncbi:hypothetical protein BD770DRAFT_446558 [Pilaira anomala]|nr:hypothetical protein BD770DRAFT_446558 [Pilaira anomala]
MSKNVENSDFQLYKALGERGFFFSQPPKNWCFNNYVQFNKELNQSKSFQEVITEYLNSVNWIVSLQAPQEIKEYASDLLKDAQRIRVMNPLASDSGNDSSGINSNGKRKLDTGDNYQLIAKKTEKLDIVNLSELISKNAHSINYWSQFLRNKKDARKAYYYSLEYNKGILVSKGISPKPDRDDELFCRNLTFPEEGPAIPIEIRDDINNVIDSDLQDGEGTFNDLLIYPFLKAVARSVAESKETAFPEFIAGLASLKAAMIQQLNSAFGDTLYKANGIIRLYGIKQLEILVLESSSCFGSTDRTKKFFGHHKSVIGAVTMLRTIPKKCTYGSVKTFAKIKVFFLHAAGKTLYLWSLKYIQEANGPPYELYLESRLEIEPEYENKEEALPKLLKFYWLLKNLLEESIGNIIILENEHKTAQKALRF